MSQGVKTRVNALSVGQGADSPCFLSRWKEAAAKIMNRTLTRSIKMYAFEMVGAILLVLFFAALIDSKPRAGTH